MFMLDYSLRNLRRASARLERTTLIRDNIDKLPFDDSVFDVVALVRVMQHIPDPDSLLSEVVRVARNGGTFVLAIGNEDRKWHRGDPIRIMVTETGHRIFSTPLGRYGHAGLERLEIRGLGAFDNLIGRKAERLFPLATLDLKTSRLWPAKPMLFIRYRVRKADGKNEPRVKCGCGGTISERRCDSCGRLYGDIIDLVTK
jgi:SAM-dependent methyltransferase